jgi:hypothetical protein
MGTRSSIAVKHGTRIKAVYCHWDGYLEHNGRVLLENYTSTKANNLVALGDISSLREQIGEKHPFDTRYEEGTEEATWTTFYGRDRSEEGTEFRSFATEDEWVSYYEGSGAEYFYLMDNGVWYCSTGNEFIPLHEAIAELDKETANA